MSDQPEASPLTRLVPVFAIVALVAMIAAAIFHVATLNEEPAPGFDRATAPAEPDYSASTSWLTRPESETPGGWERPWGVDVLWYSERIESYRGGWNAPIDWVGTEETAMTGDAWLNATPDQVKVFAPKRRYTSAFETPEEDRRAALELENEDVLSSFDYYADNDHRLRGLFVGGRGKGVEAAISIMEERIVGTEPYTSLFGGLIIAPGTSLSDDANIDLPACSREAPAYPCLLDLSALDETAAQESFNSTMSAFSQWLDENVAKPAAPLPPIETIQIAPINRPDGQ